jgi:hypothetical protein
MRDMTVIVAYEGDRFADHVRYAFEHLLRFPRREWRFCTYSELVSLPVEARDLVISYGAKRPERIRSRNLHFFASSFFGDDYLQKRSVPAVPLRDCQGIPILFSLTGTGDNAIRTSAQGLTSALDLVASTFFLLTRYEECLAGVRDQYGRFPGRCSLAGTYDYWNRPLVDEYSALLHSWLEVLDVRVPEPIRWEQSASFGICLTHDVDDLRKFRIVPPLRTAQRALRADNGIRRAARVIKDYAGSRIHGSDPYLQCAYWFTEAEISRGCRSTFFVMGDNVRYSCSHPDARDLLEHLNGLEFEVSLHAGFHSHASAANLAREKQALEHVLGRPLLGNRNHYLLWNWDSSPANLKNAGFIYDSSAGYPEGLGFRTGTCRPHRLFDLASSTITNLWEIPLLAMDTGLYVAHEGDLASIQAAICKMIETVKEHHGIATLLWHNTLYEADRSGGRELYQSVLDTALAIGGKALTAAEIAARAAKECSCSLAERERNAAI